MDQQQKFDLEKQQYNIQTTGWGLGMKPKMYGYGSLISSCWGCQPKTTQAKLVAMNKEIKSSNLLFIGF